MTQPKPLSFDGRMRRDFGVFYGAGIFAAGVVIALPALTGMSALFTPGMGGLAAVTTGATYVTMAVTGLWCCMKGTAKMARVFSDSGKSWAERNFVTAPEDAAAPRPLPQIDFNPKAEKAVKVMRPLKLARRNTPQP